MYILAVGSIGNGFNFRGPFDTIDKAIEYGEQYYPHDTWEVIPLNPPISEEPKPSNEISEKTT
jgi:hypothetical protein